MDLCIEQIINGTWSENCYVVYNQNKNAVIIDPGSEAGKIMTFIENNQLNILAVLNTHAHYDHIGAAAELTEKYSIPFYLHSADEKLLKRANLYMHFFDSKKKLLIPNNFYPLDKNIDNGLKLETFFIEIIHTPGHSKGSVCFKIENNLFAGDTLFKGDIGRIDLTGGDKDALSNSLKRLSEFQHNIIIYPGHGDKTTLGFELQYNNKFLRMINAP